MHAPGKRSAGILLPAFSPRRKGDLGIGDTLGLREWVDWAAEHHVGFIQLLPINENGIEESPYSAISSTALDPIYLAFDGGEIPCLTDSDILESREHLGPALEARLVDYPAVRKVKRALLELAWTRFVEIPEAGRAEFERFKSSESDWLTDYCLFRFLMELHGEAVSWDHWPDICNTPENARKFIAKERLLKSSSVDTRLGFHAFVQWLCFRQWRALRAHADLREVNLMGDVPIGVSWHSCDVFFNRDEFHLDWCGGSPAESMSSDPFFQEWGQNWGIPLYRWGHMEANGFEWWKNRVTRLTEIFHLFRLDHVLGFYRIYAFPWHPDRNSEFVGLGQHQASKLTGGRLPRWFVRSDESQEDRDANRRDGDARLRGVLTAINGVDVIAEDLGCVPDYVRPHLAQLGIARYKIPHWDCDDHGHPMPGDQFPEHSFASYSTHDHEPLGGIWNGCIRAIQKHDSHPTHHSAGEANGARNGLRILAEFAGIPVPADGRWPGYSETLQWRLIKSLFASNSRYTLLMITELFALDDRINRPGTTGGENWRFRLPWTLSEIRSDGRLISACGKLVTMIGITRRG